MKLDLVGRVHHVIAAEACAPWAEELQARHPNHFRYHQTQWKKFPDGTDNIHIGGFNPENQLRGSHVLFLASFHSNDATLSQLYVCITLLESLVKSLTIVLPFYPVGTMERVVVEGEVATANTLARLLSSLPPCGKTTRVMFYDLHTLQNRFYLSNHAVATMHSTIPLLLRRLKTYSTQDGERFNCIAFPDDGAAKRFGYLFEGFDIVICGKKRDGEIRKVTITDGSPAGKNVVIVDDLVQTGGTLYECGRALEAEGARCTAAFVAHGVFPGASWQRFARGGDRNVFDPFWLTNSIPTVTNTLPTDGPFEVLDMLELIVEDL